MKKRFKIVKTSKKCYKLYLTIFNTMNTVLLWSGSSSFTFLNPTVTGVKALKYVDPDSKYNVPVSGLWIRIRKDPHSFSLLDLDPGG